MSHTTLTVSKDSGIIGSASMVADNIARFSGAIVDHYQAARPVPPLPLRPLLIAYASSSSTTTATSISGVAATESKSVSASSQRVKVVVDLGCGTGLSTFIWRGRADRIIGVEPNGDMLASAKAQMTSDDSNPTKDINGTTIEFVQAIASATGLPSACADIVTCSQSLHWMEPVSTFAEVKRLLRPGLHYICVDHSILIPSSCDLCG
jgi:SAM-dependent methyltransferase